MHLEAMIGSRLMMHFNTIIKWHWESSWRWSIWWLSITSVTHYPTRHKSLVNTQWWECNKNWYPFCNLWEQAGDSQLVVKHTSSMLHSVVNTKLGEWRDTRWKYETFELQSMRYLLLTYNCTSKKQPGFTNLSITPIMLKPKMRSWPIRNGNEDDLRGYWGMWKFGVQPVQSGVQFVRSVILMPDWRLYWPDQIW